ncbi:hypothetical protein BDF21DRAFT_449166 [Thamnidium elegans]|nr:hypothetical protein BDF21DRAFT_449166 [Thamnidium elegans]
MEGMLADIIDSNIVLATITNRAAYLSANPEDDKDTEMGDVSMNKVKVAKAPVNSTYINYDDHTREKFIDKMIEDPVKRSRVAAVARQFGIAPSTATRWWKQYNKTGEVPYKKSERNVGRPSTFTNQHEQHIEELVEKNPQICAVDIIDLLTSKFEGFSISKSQMNHHLKNNMFITLHCSRDLFYLIDRLYTQRIIHCGKRHLVYATLPFTIPSSFQLVWLSFPSLNIT